MKLPYGYVLNGEEIDQIPISFPRNGMKLYKSCSFWYTCRKRENGIIAEEEIGELYARLAFRYEFSIDSLLARRIIDVGTATTSREKFYDSLNEEKLRASTKIRDYYETMRLYMRLMTSKDCVWSGCGCHSLSARWRPGFPPVSAASIPRCGNTWPLPQWSACTFPQWATSG